MNNPVAHLLLQGERTRPDAIAIQTADDEPWTYRRLNTRSAQYAHALIQHAIQPGDRVATQCEKSAELIAFHIGCIRAGGVYLPLNTSYTATEREQILTDAQPGLFVADLASISTAADDQPGEFVDIPRHRDDPAAILYTSGTTGNPKGAVLSHGNLVSNTQTLCAAWEFTENDVLLHILPLFHTHGLFVAAYCTLAAGATLHLMTKFEPTRVIAELPRASVFMGVPTHYTRLLEEVDFGAECTGRVRLFTSGSAPMRSKTHREFSERTGHQIRERYGMTETSILTAHPAHAAVHIGTVGPPLPGVELRLSAGDTGEIEVRGPNVFAGYWQRPDLHDSIFTPDGWFRTGDLGVFDADGYVEIVGRAKDLIISGGLNVYPKDVESVVDACPGVLESAVFGLFDPDLGEQVTAAVVRTDTAVTEADIISFARQSLAGFKCPRRVIFIDALPRNSLGKVQKHLLRQRFG